MITEQLVEREFMGNVIRQNHKTLMLNANDLMNAYKQSNPLTSKTVHKYLDNASTREYIEVLIHAERLPANHIHYAKKGSGGSTWMHPFLFVDFAMWLSPEFKYIAIKWMHDNLCLLRDAAGDEFKELNAVIKEVLNPEKPYVYSNECRLIQGLAEVDTGGRNYAGEEKLARLIALQKADIKLLCKGVTEYKERKRRLIEHAEIL